MKNKTLLLMTAVLGLSLVAACGADGGDDEQGEGGDGGGSSGDGDRSDDSGGPMTGCNLVSVYGTCEVGTQNASACADQGGTIEECPSERLEGTCKGKDLGHASTVYYYSEADGDAWSASWGDAAYDCLRVYMGDYTKK